MCAEQDVKVMAAPSKYDAGPVKAHDWTCLHNPINLPHEMRTSARRYRMSAEFPVQSDNG
jgi:hypothetical protein